MLWQGVVVKVTRVYIVCQKIIHNMQGAAVKGLKLRAALTKREAKEVLVKEEKEEVGLLFLTIWIVFHDLIIIFFTIIIIMTTVIIRWMVCSRC